MDKSKEIQSSTNAQQAKPDWLDNILLSKALQSYNTDQTVKVSNFTILKGFGEHYGSAMFQISIEFSSTKFPKPEPETLSVVLKAVNSNAMTQTVNMAPIFACEIRMYNEVIPAMTQLYERNGIKVEFAPELIYAANEPFQIIILKDLSSEGFKSPKTAPEELADSKLIIEKLAQFHAASYYLVENNEMDLTSFKFSVFDHREIVENFFINTLEVFKEVVKTWEGYEHFASNVENLIKNIDDLASINVPNKPGNGFNVLNHGDFHSRNLLNKTSDKNRLEKLLFIDFQTCFYGSPAMDITYALNILVKRNEKGIIPIEELLVFYHEQFVKALKSTGFLKTPPTLLDLNVELMKRGAYRAFFSICFVPMFLLDWDTVNIEEMMETGEGNNIKCELYKNPISINMLKREMKSWASNGWF